MYSVFNLTVVLEGMEACKCYLGDEFGSDFRDKFRDDI